MCVCVRVGCFFAKTMLFLFRQVWLKSFEKKSRSALGPGRCDSKPPKRGYDSLQIGSWAVHSLNVLQNPGILGILRVYLTVSSQVKMGHYLN